MTVTLTYSSDMMANRLQAELIGPQQKFEAVQAADGHAVLLAIGTDGALNAIEEASGATAAGWTVTDLSSERIRLDFPSGATVATFDAGQSAADGSLGLAMVVTSAAGNQLYLSLGNSSKDLSWTAAPTWVAFPYDDPTIALSSLEIVDVYFCEPVGATQYIVVDVVRDPSSEVKDVHRFMIDPSRNNGHAWTSHDLPIDVEAGSYDSVVGRAAEGLVDGIYTAGRAGASGQLVYVPIVNAFGSGPPLPARLDLPAGSMPEAIAAARNPDQTTDLFVVSGSTLYRFASTNQADGATPARVITNDVLTGTTQLAAMVHGGVVTLWGRNGSDQVYSLSCPLGSATDSSAWSIPLPIVSGVEHMSPYVNAVDGGNTIFSAGGGAVERITRNTTNGLWAADPITLPAPPARPSISFNSYTTTIHVTGDDGLPAGNVSVSLAANRRAGVYVNGLYYVLDASPVHVATTSLGTITIVEATGTLTGTTFTVSNGAASAVTINPMDTPFKKLAALDSGDKVAAAKIQRSGEALVPPGASTKDLDAVGSGLTKLGKCYEHLASTTSVPASTARSAPIAAGSIGDSIDVAIGDLFRWLESGVEAVIDVVEDAAGDVWRFVAKIGDAVYTAVIDSVEAVVGAAVWLFNVVKTAIEDLIRYVEMLLDWKAMGRTKAVLYNLIDQYVTGQVAGLQQIKVDIDEAIGGVEQTINTWAGITDWSGLGDTAAKPAAGSASNPMQGQTSGSQYLSHHFQNNAADISITGDAPTPDLVQSLVDDLFTALSNEATVLDEVIDQLATLAKEASTLTVEEVLRRLVGILADGVLSSAQVVIDVILDILTAVAEAALTILDTKIHIPVISDILTANDVPEISFLDLFCWIVAAAYTVAELAAGRPEPFPKGKTTTFLSTASIDELEQAFGVGPPRVAAAAEGATGVVPIPAGVADIVSVAGYASAGIFTLLSDTVSAVEANEPVGNPLGGPSAVLAILSGGSVAVTNFLVPRDPVENQFANGIAKSATGIRIMSKIVFSGPLQTRFAASSGVMRNLAVGDGRATGAAIDTILVLPALAATCWHLDELAGKAASRDRTCAILDEVGNLTSYIGRTAYAMAVIDKDPESKEIEIGVMFFAYLATAGLQLGTAEAIVA